MNEKSPTISNRLEEATRRQYGADQDPLQFVPPVTDRNVAHEIAIGVDRQLAAISEDDITKSALRAQARARHSRGETDLDKLRDEALNDRINTVAVNAELHHAALDKAQTRVSDFGEDAQRPEGVHEMGTGIPIPPRKPPQPPIMGLPYSKN